MFLKPANSDTENGIKKKLKNVTRKLYKNILNSFSFQNVPLLKKNQIKNLYSLAARGEFFFLLFFTCSPPLMAEINNISLQRFCPPPPTSKWLDA